MKPSRFMTLCRFIIGPIYRLLFPATESGVNAVNNLPVDQAVIIVANHHSLHDPIQLIVHTNRNLRFLAKRDLFHPPFGWFFRWLGLISVNRDKSGSGVSESEQYLSSGQAIGLFPEGTTKFKRPGQILPFKYGAVRMARDTDTPILPVALTGKPTLLRRRYHLEYGQLYKVDRSANLSDATHDLEQKILALLRQTGCKNAELLPGKPARNPGKQPPISSNLL